MEKWYWFYCSLTSSSFEDIISNSVHNHPNKVLIVKQKIHVIQDLNYQIVPSSVFLENKFISCIKESGEYKIKKSPCLDIDDAFASPVKMVQRLLSTPLKPSSKAPIAAHRLPLNNISYLLFLDIVQWFSNSHTHSMCYSETVKQFWHNGRKLFKG